MVFMVVACVTSRRHLGFLGLSHGYRRYTCYETSACFSPVKLSVITMGEGSHSRTKEGRRKIIFLPSIYRDKCQVFSNTSNSGRFERKLPHLNHRENCPRKIWFLKLIMRSLGHECIITVSYINFQTGRYFYRIHFLLIIIFDYFVSCDISICFFFLLAPCKITLAYRTCVHFIILDWFCRYLFIARSRFNLFEARFVFQPLSISWALFFKAFNLLLLSPLFSRKQWTQGSWLKSLTSSLSAII